MKNGEKCISQITKKSDILSDFLKLYENKTANALLLLLALPIILCLVLCNSRVFYRKALFRLAGT